MSTKKPRIAAYLPPNLFEVFEKFRAERGLSSSSATALIFATYFELNLVDVNDSVLTRLVKLEQQVIQLQANQKSKQRRKKAISGELKIDDIDRNSGFIQIDLFDDSEPN